ncbi:hypothetical protein KAR34_07320 [bacterium]|nr:hypothetical protein [bacterium]
MWDIIAAWRGEISGCLTMIITWWAFQYKLKKPFWLLWIPGAVLGLANELITEPEWTYALQWYIWRDVSLVVAMGWGIVFAWIITLSDIVYYKLFHEDPNGKQVRYLRLLATDFLVGVPIVVGNELLGLHILKVWKYNSILGWDTIIPIIQYPLEGLICAVVFVLAVLNTVRFWKRVGRL